MTDEHKAVEAKLRLGGEVLCPGLSDTGGVVHGCDGKLTIEKLDGEDAWDIHPLIHCETCYRVFELDEVINGIDEVTVE